MSQIQFKRGTDEIIKQKTNRDNPDHVLADGQPLYNKTNNTLIVGDGVKSISELKPIGGGELSNDTGDVIIKARDNININANQNININSDKFIINSNNVNIQGITPRVQNLSEAVVSISNMKSNILYKCTNTNLTSISISSFEEIENTLGEYLIEFTIGSTNNVPRVTLPSKIKYANLWDSTSYEKGYKYVIYIIDDIAYVSFVKV